MAIPLIQCIGFHYAAVRNLSLKYPYHVTRQNIRPVLFSRVQFYCYFAITGFINSLIKTKQVLRINM